jgi:protoporphyrinogen/coproporphyrinogen III oxidase
VPADQVVVIGGGVAGLAAAWELTGGPEPRQDAPHVVILESSERFGGALRTISFAGRAVDLGPDGFLGRRPEAAELCREVGIGDALVPIAASGASVWARRRLRRLPEGLVMGIPTRWWPTARSGTLGLRGRLGLVRDAVLPRPDVRGPIGDRSVGPLVARKLGRGVVDTLVDPLMGGIYAGSVDDMSAAAVYPPLLAAAQRRGGLMRALRAEVASSAAGASGSGVGAGSGGSAEGSPMFWALRGGMAALVDALTDGLASRGVDIRCDNAVEHLGRTSTGWKVAVATPGTSIDAEGVVLATPAPVTAGLLREHDEEAAGLLDAIDYASVVLVTFRVATEDVPPLEGTGFLVPRRGRSGRGRDGWAVTASTYLDRKWPHLARDGEVLIRASLGRAGDTRPASWDDEEVRDRAWEEIGLLAGIRGEPTDAVVTRFPRALPQYRVHHLLRTAGVEAAAARLGGLAVAGAAYRGVGIPACVASGRAAAVALTSSTP